MSWTSTSPDIAAFEVCIGSTSGACDVIAWQSLSASSLNLTVSGLSLTNGTTYYATLRTKDTSNQVLQTYNGNGFTVDTAAPVAPGFLDDGEHLSSTTQAPLLRWGTSTDSGSGFAKYQLAVGTTQGNTNVMAWTDVVGTNSNFLLGLLTLLEGQTYYPSVRVVDNAGNISAVTMGDGWAVTHSGFKQMAYIKASNTSTNAQFGVSIDIDGDTMVVGVPNEASNQTGITNGTGSSSDTSLAKAGAVFVYRRVNNLWQQEAYIKAGYYGGGGIGFGNSVAISGDTIVVGAPCEDSDQQSLSNGTAVAANTNRLDTGAAYIFRRNGITWVQEAFVKAPVASISDYFGRSVDIDRDTVVIGAYREDSNSTTIINGATADSNQSAGNAGAAYVIVRSGTTWSHQAYLKAPNAQNGDYFGIHVSVSGDTIAVGADGESSASTSNMADNSAVAAGAVYVFKRTSTNWAFEQYIKKSSPQSYDNFGNGFTLSGDYLITFGGLNSGNVIYFQRINGIWNFKQTITQPNTTSGGGQFGFATSIHGNLMVATDYCERSLTTSIINGSSASNDSSGACVGAAYVYKLSGAAGVDPTWSQIAYLKPSNAINNLYFGSAVGISNNLVVVGAEGEASSQNIITNGSTASSDTSAANAGAAYVFDLNQSVNPQQMAYVKDGKLSNLDRFGNAVVIKGDTMIVAAYNEDSPGTSIINGSTAQSGSGATGSGAVFVYKKANGSWVQEAVIKATNAESQDNFGSAIAFDGDTLVVTAAGEDSNTTGIFNGTTASANNSLANAGAVYVYRRNNGVWAQEAYIKANSAAAAESFGKSVSIEGDLLVIGASIEGVGGIFWSGAVYTYRRTGATWTFKNKLKATNVSAGMYFGWSVSLHKNTLAVGAVAERSTSTSIINGTTASNDTSGSSIGAVYVYTTADSGDSWVQQAYIKPSYISGMPSGASVNMSFGQQISLYGNYLAVSALTESSCSVGKIVDRSLTPYHVSNSCQATGAVFMFERNNSQWVQKSVLKSSVADVDSSYFGSSLSLANDILVVGSYNSFLNSSSIQTTRIPTAVTADLNYAGSSFVYRQKDSLWEYESLLKGRNIGDDQFGSAVSTDGVNIVVGSSKDSSSQITITNGSSFVTDGATNMDSGSVFIYSAK